VTLRAILGIVLALAFAAALFFSLFLYVAIGMAVGEFAANVFGTCVLAAVVIIVWTWGWLAYRGQR
jgi:hypothetical protein